ncbi:DNA gyrase subunit A [uncultured Olegusella sp.]|uniref:DNA gyrase subunit A n=1 Tax=uncultured Olegusella sp. TaxID=1979846 RepID=UPI002601E0E9|nr:DNA gyrase subunit A [uncultured Olegusella sp.]
MADNHNTPPEDDFVDLTNDDSYEDENIEEIEDNDEDVDLVEDYDEDNPSVTPTLGGGAGLDPTISDEAGTRLSLVDIHGGTLKPADMATEMKTSFLEYSMSVIVARALPDVRDGLKPVQRRILYAMNEAHIVPSRPHKKSAWTVGEVMGKYHPHGDSSIYDAMVRLAQDFSMRLQLVDGHGNFGSIDGDPPAAMRYTESRLTYAAMEMLRDMDKETVNSQPNYDESLQEPAVLPARFPNLLVNGSQGIAVGMATNIPPHNLAEVTNAVCMMIDNPDVSIDELMTVLPGPDFPTGGTIMGTDGIHDAYETGRGTITVRAKVHVEQRKNGRQRLVVTEIPYQVNKGTLQERIAQQVNEKRIEGISDMRDESNRKGMRIVLDLKNGAVPQVVLNNLYKRTQLQSNFNVINIALVDGVPRTLTLRQIIGHYINHQVDVVTRRTEYDLAKARKDLHIREGLLIAVDNIDEIVHIIRSSHDDAEAKSRMHERFGIDEIQAEAILQMRLRRLTGLAREELVAQIEELRGRIAYFEDLLAHHDKILSVIKDELRQISDRFSDKRRTQISQIGAQDLDVEDLIAEEDMVVTVTHGSYIKRLPVATYRSQKRGGKGIQGLSLKESDFVEDLFVASTHDYVMFFTNKGKVYRFKVHELPLGSRQSRGSALANVIKTLSEGERLSAVMVCRAFPSDEYLMFATQSGMVKKTAMSAYDNSRRDGLIAINLKNGDELVSVRRVRKGELVILTSDLGKTIVFDENVVRPTGRASAGVKGITLRGEAKVLGMEISNGQGDLFVITEKGYGKRTPIKEYPLHNRGGQGVFTISMNAKKGALVGCRVVGPQHELMIVTEAGVMIRVKVTDVSRLGRATTGVKVMNLAEGDRISAVARMVAHKKKAARAAVAGQATLDLAAAGARDADDEEPVDIGGEEQLNEDLLDDEE